MINMSPVWFWSHFHELPLSTSVSVCSCPLSGLKNKLAEAILSYHPLWLRIGLEVRSSLPEQKVVTQHKNVLKHLILQERWLRFCFKVIFQERLCSDQQLCLQVIYGEVIPLSSNSDKAGLARFIKQRLLANPELAQRYAHLSVPELYRPGELAGDFPHWCVDCADCSAGNSSDCQSFSFCVLRPCRLWEGTRPVHGEEVSLLDPLPRPRQVDTSDRPWSVSFQQELFH